MGFFGGRTGVSEALVAEAGPLQFQEQIEAAPGTLLSTSRSREISQLKNNRPESSVCLLS